MNFRNNNNNNISLHTLALQRPGAHKYVTIDLLRHAHGGTDTNGKEKQQKWKPEPKARSCG
jgi:hypothetical protein